RRRAAVRPPRGRRQTAALLLRRHRLRADGAGGADPAARLARLEAADLAGPPERARLPRPWRPARRPLGYLLPIRESVERRDRAHPLCALPGVCRPAGAAAVRREAPG